MKRKALGSTTEKENPPPIARDMAGPSPPSLPHYRRLGMEEDAQRAEDACVLRHTMFCSLSEQGHIQTSEAMSAPSPL